MNRMLPQKLDLGSVAYFRARFEVGDPSCCWLWTGELGRKGYGRTWVARRRFMATWVSLHLSGRPRPHEMAQACHACDNPQCVNPAQLWWGTALDNARDRDSKGRRDLRRLPANQRRANMQAAIAANRQRAADRSHCAAGHQLVPENIYIRPGDGGRRCRQCRTIAHHRRKVAA